MPLFYFILKNGRHTIPDRDGEELADECAARVRATDVSHELMRNRELRTRSWRLQVCDTYLQPCFEVLFASVDDTIAHMPPEFRGVIETVSRNTASLNDTVIDVRRTLAQVTETLTEANQVMTSVAGVRR